MRASNCAGEVRTAQACNLLRPLAGMMDGPVLQVGHRGPLTPYLEENAPSVTYCENLDNFTHDARFRLIVFVDTLRGEAAAGWLQRARELMAENGKIFIAASNRLRSAGEAGLRDLSEWRDLLNSCGMEAAAVLYPFPDHRSPTMLLTDRAWRDARLNIATLLAGCAGGDGLWQELPWAELVENGVAKQLANSFAIVAGRRGSTAPPLDPSCLVYYYSMARLPAFRKQTLILAESGRLLVRRCHLHPKQAENDGYEHRLEDEPYFAGRLYSDFLLEQLRVEGWGIAALAEWAGRWLDYLRAHARPSAMGSAELPTRFLDCVPFNLVLTSAGTLQPIDTEYISPEPPPLDFVAFRGIWLSLARARSTARGEVLREWTLAGLTFAVLDTAGMPIAAERRHRLVEMEAAFQHALTGADPAEIRSSLAGIRLAGSRPAAAIESQLFWRIAGTDFNEQDSEYIRTQTSLGLTTLLWHIAPVQRELAELRLDIANRAGLVRLARIRLVNHSSATVWEWDGRAATLAAAQHAEMDFLPLPLSGGAILHLRGKDPRVVLPIAGAQLQYLRYGGYLEVEFAWLA